MIVFAKPWNWRRFLPYSVVVIQFPPGLTTFSGPIVISGRVKIVGTPPPIVRNRSVFARLFNK